MISHRVQKRLTHLLELSQIVDHNTTKERLTVFQGRLINHNRCSLCFDTLHNTLNGALTEVIAIALHCQAVNADGKEKNWSFTILRLHFRSCLKVTLSELK